MTPRLGVDDNDLGRPRPIADARHDYARVETISLRLLKRVLGGSFESAWQGRTHRDVRGSRRRASASRCSFRLHAILDFIQSPASACAKRSSGVANLVTQSQLAGKARRRRYQPQKPSVFC
jgi:hypothetical protein